MPTELCDRLEQLEAAMDPDVARRVISDRRGKVKTFSVGTRFEYLKNLRICHGRGLDLLEADAGDVNEFMDAQVSDRGLSRTTVGNYQCSVIAFYRHHDDLAADHQDVVTFSGDAGSSGPSEEDMLTEREVEALREACNKPRNRAFLELLIYTGQRLSAVLSLEIRNVDLENGVFYLNTDWAAENDGLKGASDRGRKRPLFGARKHVRDWIREYHPEGDDPNAPLFVGDPDHPNTAEGEPWSQDCARRQLRRVADRAGVHKPVNPHNFRHYFTTVMRREHDVDWDTLKALLGAVRGSRIPETVYEHISNDEFVEDAEEALGFRESEDTGGSFTPDVCSTCGEPLDEGWNRCPVCGEVFAPGVEDVREDLSGVASGTVEQTADPRTELSEAEVRAAQAIADQVDDVDALVQRLEQTL